MQRQLRQRRDTADSLRSSGLQSLRVLLDFCGISELLDVFDVCVTALLVCELMRRAFAIFFFICVSVCVCVYRPTAHVYSMKHIAVVLFSALVKAACVFYSASLFLISESTLQVHTRLTLRGVCVCECACAHRLSAAAVGVYKSTGACRCEAKPQPPLDFLRSSQESDAECVSACHFLPSLTEYRLAINSACCFFFKFYLFFVQDSKLRLRVCFCLF